MNKPYVICHMTMSIDGKVTGGFLEHPECAAAIEDYYQVNRDYAADAFACGRVTMEGSFTGGFQPDLSAFADAKLPREDYVADPEAEFFAVAFDRRGRLGWKASRIVDEDPGYGDSHIIEVLCEDVSDAYLAYLQSIGVSYIFGGKEDLDLELVLEKLTSLFNIQKLLLEGGSIINGAFYRSGLIDELSLVLAPLTAAEEGIQLFDFGDVISYRLEEFQKLDGGSLWLRYKR